MYVCFMKKLLLILLCLPMIGSTQIRTGTYLEDKTDVIMLPYDSTSNGWSYYIDIEKYIGQEFYVNHLEKGLYSEKDMYGYKGFYKDMKIANAKKSNIYKCCDKARIGNQIGKKEKGFTSIYDSIQGKYFECLSIVIEQEGKRKEGFIKFKEKKSGDIMYYKMGGHWPFIIMGYYNKLKQSLLGAEFKGYYESYSFQNKEIKDLYENKMVDYTTEKWICVDLVIEEEDNQLAVVLENAEKKNIMVRFESYDKNKMHFYNHNSRFYKQMELEKDSRSTSSYENQLNLKKIFHIANKDTTAWIEFYKNNIVNFLKKEAHILNSSFNYDSFNIITLVNSNIILKDNRDSIIIIGSLDLEKFLENELEYEIKTSYRNDIDSKLEYKDFEDAKQEELVMKVIKTDASSPNSASGVDFSIDWYYYNTKKDIKYIYFTVAPYNEVGDRQYCNIRDYATFTGSATGPISASSELLKYTWGNAWYNNTIKKVKIIKVSIEYEDGTNYTYVKELNKILSPYIINK